jgi:hypothetical protein
LQRLDAHFAVAYSSDGNRRWNLCTLVFDEDPLKLLTCIFL